MILICDALKIIETQVKNLAAEKVEIADSCGRVLAEEIRADMDLPPFNRSQMDGFAVKVKDTKNAPVKLRIVGESSAGTGFDGKIKLGEAVRIMTGARIPDGADAVQKVELTNESDGFITILEPTKLKQHIVNRADEIKKGVIVFEKGEIISAQKIATLASFGYAEIKVAKKPRVAILATGSEIVPIMETPQKDQIRNSNSIMLKVFAEKYADVQVFPIVKDELENLKSEIKKTLETCDTLIISGGVSVGDYDFTKPALRDLGAEIFFEKVSLRPGKPTVFAKLADKYIFGLPGNPVSVAVTFFLFVRTALLKMQNAADCQLKQGFAVASAKIKGAKERDSFLPVKIETAQDGKFIIESLRFSGSSNFIAFANANALAFVPQGETYANGDVVKIAYLP